MTGYGRGEAALEGKKFVVEVRSLNSKQLDLTVKLPTAYRSLEYDIRAMASKMVQRGKAEISVNCEQQSAAAGVSINRELFKAYYNELLDVAGEVGLGMDSDMIGTILRLPDVVKSDVGVVPEAEYKAVMDAACMAIENFDAFRVQEGAVLIADLTARIDKIAALRIEVEPFEKERVEVVKNRIRESIENLKIPLDSNRLEQEMIFYVEKLDITEEKIRLDNHLKYFKEVASEEQGVGRKLGFITQEIGREINTLGSKANDARMQKIVVEMKDELEKIKEQSLNIL